MGATVSGSVRQRMSIEALRWLGAAAAATGIALWPNIGVAAAAPPEGSDTAQSQDTAEDTESTEDDADPEQTDEDVDEADLDLDEADLDDDVDLDEDDLDEDVDLDQADEDVDLEEIDEDVDLDEDNDHDNARADDDAQAVQKSDDTAVEPVSADKAGEDVAEIQTATVETERGDNTGTSSAASLVAPPATRTTPTTVRALVSAQPVTVKSIVTDVLTWIGLRPFADHVPLPTTPITGLVESLWLAVRQAQYTWNNQRPTADPTTSEPGPDGIVSGSLNAVDYDDTSLVYTVTEGPKYGKLTVDANGNFVYKAGAAGLADRFTVAIDDTAANPFHTHGLLGFLGVTKPVEVTVTIAASTPLAAQDRAAVESHDGVVITENPDGSVKVIDGRFLDRTVTSAADAAAVLNALASTLGVAPGFADPSAITASTAATDDVVEHFYRLTETVKGISVIGSDVILVTDAVGGVTGVYNNYVGLDADFVVNPDASVDTGAEVTLIAGKAYLGTGASSAALDKFFVKAVFVNQLVVYALDDAEVPSLAWQVIVHVPDTGAMASSGATYVIDADGSDAGRIIVSVSNANDASVTGVATDWLGQPRTINFDTTKVWIFSSTTLVDRIRNIATYKTSYTFFGYGGPKLPGTVIKRSGSTWDKAAVSAHANAAIVYDFYDTVLGRKSYDGNGARITISIKYNPVKANAPGYVNAFWDPTIKQFAFGDSGYLQAAVDVVAHEFTHAVVTSVVGKGDPVLDFGQSGALNEALADIMGSLVEGKSDAGRWLIGEDSPYGSIRNLANPGALTTSVGPYRSHMSQYYTGKADDYGEHVNSTIFSHAAYKMMTDPATVNVPTSAWASLFYRAIQRLSPGAQFSEGRAAVLGAAVAEGSSLKPYEAVIKKAFDDVGIKAVATSSFVAA